MWYKYVNLQVQVIHNLTCGNDLTFEGIPEAWHENCTLYPGKCTLPIPPAESNLNSEPNEGSDQSQFALGDTLTFDCKDGHASESAPFTITCGAYPTESLGLELKFSSDWGTCNPSRRRKKRQLIRDGVVPKLYQYINVIVDIQFNEEVTYDQAQ